MHARRPWKFADAVLSANGELTELHALAEKAAKDAKRAASEASRAEASLEKDRVLRRPPASVVTTVIGAPKCGSADGRNGDRACYF